MWSVSARLLLLPLPNCWEMMAAAPTPARKSSRWLWFLIKKLILIGYMVGGVGRIFGKIISRSLARVSCHDCMLSVQFESQKHSELRASLRIKQRLRPKTWRGRSIQLSGFELLLWCLWMSVIVFVYEVLFTVFLSVCIFVCVCVHESVGPHILLVFQNLTSLHLHWLFILETALHV